MNEYQLISACLEIGIHVVFAPFYLAGAYIKELELILIDSRQSESSRRAVLAHEYAHALKSQNGEQSKEAEIAADQHAARLLICHEKYRQAEILHDGEIYGISEELDLPLWAIEAYRQKLASSERIDL